MNLAKKKIIPFIDLEHSTEIALGSYWSQLDSKQRKIFGPLYRGQPSCWDRYHGTVPLRGTNQPGRRRASVPTARSIRGSLPLPYDLVGTEDRRAFFQPLTFLQSGTGLQKLPYKKTWEHGRRRQNTTEWDSRTMGQTKGRRTSFPRSFLARDGKRAGRDTKQLCKDGGEVVSIL